MPDAAAADPNAEVFFDEKGEEEPEKPPKPEEENGFALAPVLVLALPKAEPEPDAAEGLAKGEEVDENAPNVA